MANKRSKKKNTEPAIYEPEDFCFDPACGVNYPKEQQVAVSGIMLSYREIDNHGRSYEQLSGVFRKIDKRRKKKGSKEEQSDTSDAPWNPTKEQIAAMDAGAIHQDDFEQAVDEVSKKSKKRKR